MTGQPQFREYVTSGAFKFSLSRAQIHAISMVAETGQTSCGGHTFAALYHKGLIEHIRAETGGLEYRLTEAGVYALGMCRLAELTNGAADPIGEENAALRRQLNTARVAGQQLAADIWDMKARLDKAESALKEARAMMKGEAVPKRPLVTMKDKHPERTVPQMLSHLEQAEAMLTGEPVA